MFAMLLLMASVLAQGRTIESSTIAGDETCEIIVLANPTEGGTVSGGGSYFYGEIVTVTARPAFGYLFVDWTEGNELVSCDASYSFMVKGDRILTAYFVGENHNIIVSANPPEGGEIFGNGTYSHGETITVSAMGNLGYNFVNWLEGGVEVSTDVEYTFIVTADRALIANFATYDITVSANPPECGVSGGGNYRPGVLATISATTKTVGYDFVSWTKGGVVVSTDVEYTFITAIGDMEFVANFKETSVAIDAVENFDINIYPNPITGELRIVNYESRIDNVEIFDVMGRSVWAQHVLLETRSPKPETIINISHLSDGIYFMRITTETGIVTKKVVKR